MSLILNKTSSSFGTRQYYQQNTIVKTSLELIPKYLTMATNEFLYPLFDHSGSDYKMMRRQTYGVIPDGDWPTDNIRRVYKAYKTLQGLFEAYKKLVKQFARQFCPLQRMSAPERTDFITVLSSAIKAARLYVLLILLLYYRLLRRGSSS